MENKKIAFLINSLTAGGAERVLSIILAELEKTDIQIELICLENNIFYKIPKNIKVTYLSDSDGNTNSIGKLLSMPLLAKKLKKHIKENNIDLVQSHIYRANFINALSKQLGSSHEVQMVNAGQVSMYKSKGLLGKVNLFLVQKLYPLSNKVICKSKGMEYDLQTYFNGNLNTTIINNPYDLEKIKILTEESINDFDFNEDKKYLIYVGRFASFKRPDYVIESLKYLDENVELILLGDGPKKETLIELSESLNLSNRVHFLGKVSNPYKYMKQSDVFILSSDDGEGFPNVLAEAMACQTSVIATDCKSGPREILSPKSEVNKELVDDLELCENGILVPKGKPKIIAKAINIILEDSTFQKQITVQALNRVNDFSKNSIIEKYKDTLFNKVSK